MKDMTLILLGSILYAAGTVLFIFPHLLLLGGTSGISVIVERFIDFSPGTILMAINFSLLLVSFIVLGREMAFKTLIGSVLTTVGIGAFEKLFSFDKPLIGNAYASAVIGALAIALASALLFYVNSSSGGTDIIALIVKKFSGIKIGKALLITDILIVILGGMLSGVTVFVSSLIGLLIKTFGIDAFIFVIKKRIDNNVK